MAIALEAVKPPPAVGDRGLFGRVWNGERWLRPQQTSAAAAPAEPRRVGGQSTASKPTRSDIMALGMNDKLPPGQEQIVNADELGDTRLRAGQPNGEGAVISTNEPPKYVQYDDFGIARRINRSTYLEVKRAVDKDGHRLHDSCPLCGGDHPETEWDPNACSAREPLSGFLCPQCGKECWPDGAQALTVKPTSTNPAMKALPLDDKVLDKMALTNLHEHIGTYHPSLARSMGIAVNALAYGGSGLAPTVGAGVPR